MDMFSPAQAWEADSLPSSPKQAVQNQSNDMWCRLEHAQGSGEHDTTTDTDGEFCSEADSSTGEIIFMGSEDEVDSEDDEDEEDDEEEQCVSGSALYVITYLRALQKYEQLDSSERKDETSLPEPEPAIEEVYSSSTLDQAPPGPHPVLLSAPQPPPGLGLQLSLEPLPCFNINMPIAQEGQ